MNRRNPFKEPEHSWIATRLGLAVKDPEDRRVNRARLKAFLAFESLVIVLIVALVVLPSSASGVDTVAQAEAAPVQSVRDAELEELRYQHKASARFRDAEAKRVAAEKAAKEAEEKKQAQEQKQAEEAARQEQARQEAAQAEQARQQEAARQAEAQKAAEAKAQADAARAQLVASIPQNLEDHKTVRTCQAVSTFSECAWATDLGGFIRVDTSDGYTDFNGHKGEGGEWILTVNQGDFVKIDGHVYRAKAITDIQPYTSYSVSQYGTHFFMHTCYDSTGQVMKLVALDLVQ